MNYKKEHINKFMKKVNEHLFRHKIIHRNAIKVFLAIYEAIKIKNKEILKDPGHLPHTSFLNVVITKDDIKDNLLRENIDVDKVLKKYLIPKNFVIDELIDGDRSVTGHSIMMYRLPIGYKDLPKSLKTYLDKKVTKFLKNDLEY